ncbi:MAG: DUF3854 domain-containing protein [Planctomycetaceae bacterium]|nr:DUF3854 domain-containing protein [Planctomycetaceae bacterium]
MKDGKPVKYESPIGQPNRVYYPPGTESLVDNADQELLITEGEKKALAGTQNGFPAIGLVGIYGWKDARNERLLPELERISWKQRRVFIAFDSDIRTNQNVRDAALRLAEHLRLRGAIVRLVMLPEKSDAEGKPIKVGLDDFLVAQGENAQRELRRLLNEAEEPEKPDAAQMKQSAGEIDPATEAERFLKTGERDGCYSLAHWQGQFHLYGRGHYEEVQAGEVRSQLVRHLNPNFSHVTRSVVENIMLQVQAQCLVRGKVEWPAWIGDTPPVNWRPRDVLSARNGLINLREWADGNRRIIPATPRFFTPTALDYDVDPNAAQPFEFLNFLHSLWDDVESIETLQEWFGYTLTGDTSQQKILGLFGPKRSGKGTIVRTQSAMLGTNNVAGPTFSSIGDRFGLWPLYDKSLAIFNDARLSGRTDNAVVVERLLSISGEDALTVDRKNLPPKTGKLPTRLMIVSNELPRLGDSSGALVGRMIVLQLRKTFYGREDTTLRKRLLTELPGILLWAIEGWRRLRERGRFVQPAASADLIDDLDELSSPIGQFVRERCVVGPGFRESISNLYRIWVDWCKEKGIKEPGIEQGFGRNLAAVIPDLHRVRPTGPDGERYRAYEGIGLRFT